MYFYIKCYKSVVIKSSECSFGSAAVVSAPGNKRESLSGFPVKYNEAS